MRSANSDLAERVRAALRRLRVCPVHHTLPAEDGRYCVLCQLEALSRAGRKFRSVPQIMGMYDEAAAR